MRAVVTDLPRAAGVTQRSQCEAPCSSPSHLSFCISQAARAREMVHLMLQGRWKAAQPNQAARCWRQGQAAPLPPRSPGLCYPLLRLWDWLTRSILCPKPVPVLSQPPLASAVHGVHPTRAVPWCLRRWGPLCPPGWASLPHAQRVRCVCLCLAIRCWAALQQHLRLPGVGGESCWFPNTL